MVSILFSRKGAQAGNASVLNSQRHSQRLPAGTLTTTNYWFGGEVQGMLLHAPTLTRINCWLPVPWSWLIRVTFRLEQVLEEDIIAG